MLEWLVANWLPLLIVILAIVAAVAIILKRKGLRQTAIEAIVWAEASLETEEGKEKMNAAIQYVQQIVPFLKFIPNSMIEAFIQNVFDQIKIALDHEPTHKDEIAEDKNEEKTIEEVSSEEKQD